MSKFKIDPHVPVLIAETLLERLSGLEWLIPGWCQRVYVRWNEQGDSKGTLISCSVAYEYREVCLTFFRAFLSEGELQHERVIHDLLHGFSSVLVDYADDVINLLVPESEAPKFRENLLNELRVKHESFVQDLAFALAQKLH